MTGPQRANVDDLERPATLDGCDVLDTAAEPEFDGLVLLASQICRTATALVSVVDVERQWFEGPGWLRHLRDAARPGQLPQGVIDPAPIQAAVQLSDGKSHGH